MSRNCNLNIDLSEQILHRNGWGLGIGVQHKLDPGGRFKIVEFIAASLEASERLATRTSSLYSKRGLNGVFRR